ncbi:MAG: antibiotic biosynthesis monooxygenase family protein [Planctomycetota bacterium]
MIIHLTVKNENDVEKVAELVTKQGQLSRAEPGCVRFDVYQSDNDPKVFFLNEWWETQEALDVHRTAEAYVDIYKPHVLPLVDRVPHPSTLLE